MSREQQKLRILFQKLVVSDLVQFPAERQRLNAPTERGVYIIYRRGKTVLHVGNTPRGRNGIRGRLYDHLNGRSSFSKRFLDGEGGQLRSGHSFRYIVEPDGRKMALLQAYAIGKLCPKHVGTG